MKYTAMVITRDLGQGPKECIRCKDEYGYLVGFFDSIEALAKRVDISLVDITGVADLG